MADKSAAPENPSPDATPKKKKSKTLLFGTLGLVVLTGGGAAAYWFTRPTAEAAATEEKVAESEPGGIVSFEPFVVNLADGAGARFLRISIQLVVPGKKVAEEIDKDDVLKARLRSTLLELLAAQTSDRLVLAEGKAELKKTVAERVKPIIKPHEVSDVLFTDFIVQF